MTSRDFHKTHRRLNESRSHYVATAVSAGYDYNGCGMFADEYVFAAEGHAKAAPCLTYEQAKALPFPPLLVNADGKRVADGQQICKHSWKGKDCPLKSCNYRHVSKDGFVGELESGKAAAIPAQMHKQQQQQSGNSSYSASGSGASTLDEQRLKLLEDNLTKQSELLLQVSTKLDTIQSSSAGADSQALKARREAAEKKRAQLAMQQATLAAELDEIDKAAQDGGAFISVAPQSEEFWVGSVLNSAAKMLGRFDQIGRRRSCACRSLVQLGCGGGRFMPLWLMLGPNLQLISAHRAEFPALGKLERKREGAVEKHGKETRRGARGNMDTA